MGRRSCFDQDKIMGGGTFVEIPLQGFDTRLDMNKIALSQAARGILEPEPKFREQTMLRKPSKHDPFTYKRSEYDVGGSWNVLFTPFLGGIPGAADGDVDELDEMYNQEPYLTSTADKMYGPFFNAPETSGYDTDNSDDSGGWLVPDPNYVPPPSPPPGTARFPGPPRRNPRPKKPVTESPTKKKVHFHNVGDYYSPFEKAPPVRVKNDGKGGMPVPPFFPNPNDFISPPPPPPPHQSQSNGSPNKGRSMMPPPRLTPEEEEAARKRRIAELGNYYSPFSAPGPVR